MENPTFELLSLIREDCEEFKTWLSEMTLDSLDEGASIASAYLSVVSTVFENTFGAYMKDYPIH